MRWADRGARLTFSPKIVLVSGRSLRRKSLLALFLASMALSACGKPTTIARSIQDDIPSDAPANRHLAADDIGEREPVRICNATAGPNGRTLPDCDSDLSPICAFVESSTRAEGGVTSLGSALPDDEGMRGDKSEEWETLSLDEYDDLIRRSALRVSQGGMLRTEYALSVAYERFRSELRNGMEAHLERRNAASPDGAVDQIKAPWVYRLQTTAPVRLQRSGDSNEAKQGTSDVVRYFHDVSQLDAGARLVVNGRQATSHIEFNGKIYVQRAFGPPSDMETIFELVPAGGDLRSMALVPQCSVARQDQYQ